MGLLSFLTKKSPGDNATNLNAPELKGQAYDTATQALPPIRGGLPVTGNGPNGLDDLRRAARKRSEAQLSTRSNASNASADPAAPPPMVPRLRSKSFGRPSTAPSVPPPLPLHRPKSSGRSARDPAAPPSPFLTKSTPGPPYLLGMTGPEGGDDDDDDDDKPYGHVPESAPPVPPIASHFMKAGALSPVTKGPGSTAGSVASGPSPGAKPAHVDLLDAQGSFKPSDFKTRLHASGARDYGEDVAERNIGVNGVDLNSPAVVAFYALTGGGPLAYKSDGSAVDVHGNKYAAGSIPSDLATEVQGRDKDQLSALANKRLRTPKFPTRTTSLQPHQAAISEAAGDLAIHGAKAGKDDGGAGPRRRVSVHGGPLSSANSQPKPRPLSMHPTVSTSAAADPATAPDIPRSRQTRGSAATGLTPKLPSSRSQSRDSAAASKKKQKDDRPRSRSAKSVRSTASVAASQRTHHESEEAEEPTRPRSVSSSSRKARRPDRRHDDHGQFNLGVPSTGEYVPSVPSSHASSRPASSSGHQDESRPQSQRSGKSSQMAQARTEPSPQRLARPAGSSSSRPRNKSVGGASMRGKPQLDDISEYMPGRRTPRRDESISSVANTTASSNQSSNPFPRPQSRHTADTSLDLGYTLPALAKSGHVRGKSSGTTVSSGRVANYQSQRAQAPSPFAKALDTDDYLTTTTDGSDIESYMAKKHRKAQDDEGLLFKEDAYGQTGGGLPGLFDADEGPTTPTWSSMQPVSGKQRNFSRTRPPTSAPRFSAEPSSSSASRRQPPVSFPAWGDDDDSSSLTVSESDADRSQSGSILDSTKPSSAGTAILGAGEYDPVEEEMDEQLDVKLAVRLRKEMKRRERTSIRRQTLQAKAAMENYEQGHVADTET